MLENLYRRRLLQFALLGVATPFLVACEAPEDPLESIRKHFLQDISHLPALDGRVPPFAVYSGVALVVNIWASWCPPCVLEMPSLEKLSTLFHPQDLRVIGITVDNDVNLVREFLLRAPVTFPLLWDRGNNILHIPTFPSTFLLRRDHTIARVIVGQRDWGDSKLVEETESLLSVQRIQPLNRSSHP